MNEDVCTNKIVMSTPVQLEMEVRKAFGVREDERVILQLYISDVDDYANYEESCWNMLNEHSVNKIKVKLNASDKGGTEPDVEVPTEVKESSSCADLTTLQCPPSTSAVQSKSPGGLVNYNTLQITIVALRFTMLQIF